MSGKSLNSTNNESLTLLSKESENCNPNDVVHYERDDFLRWTVFVLTIATAVWTILILVTTQYVRWVTQSSPRITTIDPSLY